MTQPDRVPDLTTSPAPLSQRALWKMLLALTAAFAMSHAFRTIAAIMATPLQADFALSAQQLGLFAAAFHFAFGVMQLFMGVGIDLHGLRRTVLVAFPLAVAGAALSAASTQFGWLVLGQVMIGVGCAPAFLACTVFIARNWPAERFAAVSGLVITIGSVGMLATSTPLAWLIEASSWRAAFWVLSAGSAAAWLLVLLLVREISVASPGTAARRESLAGAVRGFGALLLVRHTAGILMLSSVSYAAYIALRGLWLGPLLITRHGFSLVESGNVVLAVSVASLIGPPLFGRLDPGPLARRRWIVIFTCITASLLTMMAFATSAWIDVALACVIALVSGYMVLQYADVRSAYPVAMVGRALSLFTMAMFMGIALVQWLTGLAASHAALVGLAPFTAVLLSLALLLVAGATAFTWLPRPPT